MAEEEKQKIEEIAWEKALKGNLTMKLDSFEDIPGSPEIEKGTINFDELFSKKDMNWQPRFFEEILRNDDGTVEAYVLRRNQNYKKE